VEQSLVARAEMLVVASRLRVDRDAPRSDIVHGALLSSMSARSRFFRGTQDSDEAYLMQLIESSPSYNYVRKIRVGEITGNKFQAFERIAIDNTAEGAATGMDLLSGLFGNSVGLFESRKGKLHGDEDALKKIQAQLQPLDILLEKMN